MAECGPLSGNRKSLDSLVVRAAMAQLPDTGVNMKDLAPICGRGELEISGDAAHVGLVYPVRSGGFRPHNALQAFPDTVHFVQSNQTEKKNRHQKDKQ